MRILLAGASGLIGPPLAAALRARGHEVHTLVRRAPSGPDETRWDPASGSLDVSVLDGTDAAVCLSGVGINAHRWTDSYKKQIVDSRVDSVGTMARAVAAKGTPVFVSASAVGYYGDTGDTVVDESAPPGDRFLSDVCVQWEAAAAPAGAAGARVAHARTGLVLAKGGGLLTPLVPLTKFGVNGRLGSGRQYFPWISITDEIAALVFLIEGDIVGPANLTGPAPVTNAEFTKALGAVLHRPTVLVVPGFAAHLALGEFAGDVLIGQRAVPDALQEAGFEFQHRDVETALRAVLG